MIDIGKISLFIEDYGGSFVISKFIKFFEDIGQNVIYIGDGIYTCNKIKSDKFNNLISSCDFDIDKVFYNIDLVIFDSKILDEELFTSISNTNIPLIIISRDDISSIATGSRFFKSFIKVDGGIEKVETIIKFDNVYRFSRNYPSISKGLNRSNIKKLIFDDSIDNIDFYLFKDISNNKFSYEKNISRTFNELKTEFIRDDKINKLGI